MFFWKNWKNSKRAQQKRIEQQNLFKYRDLFIDCLNNFLNTGLGLNLESLLEKFSSKQLTAENFNDFIDALSKISYRYENCLRSFCSYRKNEQLFFNIDAFKMLIDNNLLNAHHIKNVFDALMKSEQLSYIDFQYSSCSKYLIENKLLTFEDFTKYLRVGLQIDRFLGARICYHDHSKDSSTTSEKLKSESFIVHLVKDNCISESELVRFLESIPFEGEFPARVTSYYSAFLHNEELLKYVFSHNLFTSSILQNINAFIRSSTDFKKIENAYDLIENLYIQKDTDLLLCMKLHKTDVLSNDQKLEIARMIEASDVTRHKLNFVFDNDLLSSIESFDALKKYLTKTEKKRTLAI